MDSQERDYRVVDSYMSAEPEIGRWLWAFQDTRRRTLRELDGLTQTAVDWLPGDNESSIGTVLYHIALIECAWLYTEVLEQPVPPTVLALFPYDHRDEQGRLTQVQGMTLNLHLRRLEKVRELSLEVYQQMSLLDFRRPRSLPDYDVTPEWVLHHLIQHEAEHRSQIGSLRARAERRLDQI